MVFIAPKPEGASPRAEVIANWQPMWRAAGEGARRMMSLV